ncbi:MAG: hypothetical protein WCJ33_05565 [Pseudomonadota bacterium]
MPEQTLGRGLRRMFAGSDIKEQVSVVGTKAFMEFVQSIKSEGVEIERIAMGAGTQAKSPVVIEVEEENDKKDIAALDIELPILTPRIYREYKNFSEIDITHFDKPINEKPFSEQEQREIVFKDIATDEISHTTLLNHVNPAPNNMIAFFVNNIKRDLRLVGGHEILHGKVKDFLQNQLFGKAVMLDNLNIMRNLSEPVVTKTIYDFFKTEINRLTIKDKGEAVIDDHIRLRKTRPFSANQQAFYQPKKSVFNKIIGDSEFELKFASFLDGCDDIISFGKNCKQGIKFKLDYLNRSGDISNYYPDFIVKKSEKEIYIIETKGIEDLDVPLKIARLKEWCKDINELQNNVKYNFIFVEYNAFKDNNFKSFEQVIQYFITYQ